MLRPSRMSIPVAVHRSRIPPAPSAPLEVWLAPPAAAVYFRPAQSHPADRRRYAQLRTARRRAEFAASRALLAHVAPRTVYSLSHSAGSAALAHGPDVRLGVDLQYRRPRDCLSLARFAFAAEEADALARLSGAARGRHFHDLWVMKEAMAKALGLALLDALRRCVFTCEDGRWRASIPHAGAWSLFLFEPRVDASLAVAAIGDLRDARPLLYEWPPRTAVAWPEVASLACKDPVGGSRGAPPELRFAADESRRIIDLESVLPTSRMTSA